MSEVSSQQIIEDDNDISTAAHKPAVIFVLGLPGSGRGTLVNHYCQDHNTSSPNSTKWLYLSVGDYLRTLSDLPSPYRHSNLCDTELTAHQLKAMLDSGKLLSADAMVKLLRYRLTRKGIMIDTGDDTTKGIQYHTRWEHSRAIFVEGFPRTLEAAKLFEEEIVKPIVVLNVKCNRAVAEGRFIARASFADNSKEVFNQLADDFMQFNPAILQHYNDKCIIANVDSSGNLEDLARQRTFLHEMLEAVLQ